MAVFQKTYSLTANSQSSDWIILEGATSTIIAFQITGTWTATVTFQGAVDTASPVSLLAVPTDSTTGATTTTANGVFRVDGAGLKAVRVLVTAFTSGTIVVTVGAHHG